MKRLLLCILMVAIPLSFTVGNAEDNATGEVPQEIIKKIYEQIPSLADYKPYSGRCQSNGNYSVYFSSYSNSNSQVTTDADGIVQSFMIMEKNAEQGKRLPKISKADATQKAIDFVKYTAADIYDQLNVKGYTNTYVSNSSSSGYNVRFTRSISGITYSHDSVNVWINAKTGEPTRYNRYWNDKLQFSPPQDIISQKQAEDAYKSSIGLELRYNKKTEKGKAIPYLVYVPSSTGTIDAATGEVIRNAPPAVTTSYTEMLALYEKTSITATPVENENAESEGLVTGREAQKHAREMPELKIDSDYITQQAKYYKNTNGQYLITLKFVKGESTINITLDAKNLGIVGFTNSKAADYKSAPAVDKLKVTAVANSFINKYMPEYKNELSNPQISLVEGGESNNCVILFERIVNGVNCKSNYAQFLINSEGTIISMSFLWDDAVFDSPSSVISANEAYSIFLDKVGLSLIYTNTQQNSARLVYAVNPQVPAIIDAYNGTLLSYDGTKAKPKKSLSYMGLKGHYAENQATALADCDIFVSEGNVLLEGDILQKDFMVLLSAISPDGMPIYQKSGGITDEELDMIYKDLITKGVLGNDEVDPSGYVMREDAVKYLLRVAGYKGVAELEGIFKMPFKDSKKILPELYGYVALARGLNLISGSDGYFYPTKNLTNADAIIMVYNYLNRGN